MTTERAILEKARAMVLAGMVDIPEPFRSRLRAGEEFHPAASTTIATALLCGTEYATFETELLKRILRDMAGRHGYRERGLTTWTKEETLALLDKMLDAC